MGMYCGTDLAGKQTEICILDERRQVKAQEAIKTTSREIRKFFSRYRGLRVIVEAAPLAEWFCKEVEACKRQHVVEIVCPRRAKAVLSGQTKKKTDKRDARALAELCKSGWYTVVHRKSEGARELRSFLTARKQLVECSTAIASSIRGILRAHGVRLTAGSDEACFGDKVRQAGEKLPPQAREGILELLRAYEFVHKQQRDLYKKLRREVPKQPLTARLADVPSIGPATAAAFVATIDDPLRFESGDQVASYLGLVPSIYQSGDTEYRGRITKTGDKLLRWLLVESGNNLLTRSASTCALRTWGLRLQEKKGIGKARVAVARKLCVILWKIWRDEVAFNPEAMAA